MTSCPACGASIEEGKAYCSNPACGAVPPAKPAPANEAPVEKEAGLKFKPDFVLLARLGALLIAALALGYLYFVSLR